MGILWFPSWKSKCSWNSGIRIWTERGRILPPDSIWKLREYVGSDQENWEYLIENLAAAPRASDHGVDLAVYGGVLQPVNEKKRKVWSDFVPQVRNSEDSWDGKSSDFPSNESGITLFSFFSCYRLFTPESTPWSDALGAAANLKWYLALSFIQPLCVSIPKQNHS